MTLITPMYNANQKETVNYFLGAKIHFSLTPCYNILYLIIPLISDGTDFFNTVEYNVIPTPKTNLHRRACKAMLYHLLGRGCTSPCFEGQPPQEWRREQEP